MLGLSDSKIQKYKNENAETMSILKKEMASSNIDCDEIFIDKLNYGDFDKKQGILSSSLSKNIDYSDQIDSSEIPFKSKKDGRKPKYSEESISLTKELLRQEKLRSKLEQYDKLIKENERKEKERREAGQIIRDERKQ